MFSIDYEDFGTPAAVVPRDPNGANGANGAGALPRSVTLEIDGHPITVPDGTSVMRAAALAG